MKCGNNKPDSEGANPFDGMRKDFRAPFSSTAYFALGGSGEASGFWIETEVLDLSLGGVRVSFELDDDRLKDLPETACSVKFSIKGEDKIFPGHVAWVSSGLSEKEGTIGSPEAGISFEGLSLDDKSDLVSLFMWTTLEKGTQQESGDL